MDPIDLFIRGNKKISLKALLDAHAILSVIQTNKGSLLFDDVLQSLTMSRVELSTADLNAHATLIFEGVLTQMPGLQSRLTLQMNREVVNNESVFLRSILNVLYGRCGGLEYSTVEEFNMEAYMHLKHRSSSAPPPPPSPVASTFAVAAGSRGNPSFSSAPTRSAFPQQPPMMSLHSSGFGQQQHYQRSPFNQLDTVKRLPPARKFGNDSVDDHRSLGRIEFEKSEPIVRLLAQVRKVGMDILFPQNTHDKILACIYVAICSSTTPAHRELIDMVMAVKESEHVSNLESVSKTKVRGVLALLKHGEMLVTQGKEGEPVRLFLSPGISSFKELREKHDVFLNKYMSEHHLFIPAVLKSELVWQLDGDALNQRMEAMNRLVQQLEYFFQGYQTVPLTEGDGDSSQKIEEEPLPVPLKAGEDLGDDAMAWITAGKIAAHGVRRQQASQPPAPEPVSFANTRQSSNFPSHYSSGGSHTAGGHRVARPQFNTGRNSRSGGHMNNQPSYFEGGLSSGIFSDSSNDYQARSRIANNSNWTGGAGMMNDWSGMGSNLDLGDVSQLGASTADYSNLSNPFSHYLGSNGGRVSLEDFSRSLPNGDLPVSDPSDPSLSAGTNRFNSQLGSSMFS